MKKLLFILICLAFAQPAFAGYTGYSYRASLTIPFGWFATDLSNFPILITASSVPAALFDYANADGGDIRFSTDTAGDSPLNRQIVAYDNATDAMEAWVKVPSVSSTTDTVIYIWYGNAGASEPAANDADEGSQGVWDANFKGVYHLQEAVNTTEGGYKDSTSNLHHLTGVSMALDAQPGRWGGLSAEFDGSADYIATTSVPISSYPMSVSMWMNPDNETANLTSFSIADTSVENVLIGLRAGGATGGDPIRAMTQNTVFSSADKGDFAATTWQHISGTFNTTSRFASLDGVQGAEQTASTNFAATYNKMTIGALLTSTLATAFNGKLDEVRVSNSTRSAAWIAAEYNSGALPGNITDGTPVPLGGTPVPFLQLLSTFNLLGTLEL